MFYKVLVIDNNSRNIKDLQEYFEFNDIKADYVKTDMAALKAAMKGDYDLILMNNDFCDGILMTQKVLEKRVIPIIHCISEHSKIKIMQSLNSGAVDCVTYPFDMELLIAKIKSQARIFTDLRAEFSGENEVIKVRDITIDKKSRRVFINGIEKVLTTREFDLLVFLAGHPNRVYTREQLFSEIWGMKSIGNIATVTVHIKKLREKIESEKNRDYYIETLWGSGYRFKI